MLKVVFLCLDDEYAGRMQDAVYREIPDCICGIVASTTYYGRMGFLQTAFTILRKSGFRYVYSMAQLKIIKARTNDSLQSPVKLAKRHGVPIIETDNINSKDSINRIIALEPDIVIATNVNQDVGKSVRSIPKLGTLNVHKAFLPKHRGMAPSF